MLPAALVTKEISPNSRLVPLLMRMAAPIPSMTMAGSAQLRVVRARMKITYTTAMQAIWATSTTVERVAAAVDTAEPVRAPLPPSRASMAATASARWSSATVMVSRAAPSL